MSVFVSHTEDVKNTSKNLWENVNKVEPLEYQRVNGRIIRVKNILKKWDVKMRHTFSTAQRRIQWRRDENMIMNTRIP